MSDLIDRQAAIDALNEVSEHYTEKGREWHPHVNFMTAAIKELPSAQQWIPVTERLPDFGISVLLNDGYSYAVGYLIKTTEGKYEWGVNGWYNNLEDWSAWIPLPEPYRKNGGTE